jgi:hypothetical protein
MSLNFIRQQTIGLIIRLRSNSQRTDLALFCEQDESASMPVVALMASRCYRSSRARPQTQSHSGKSAVPVSRESAIVLAAVQDQAFGGVLTATARDGVAIQRPGREDGSAGAEPENDGEEESARRYRPLCIGASTVVERAD